MALIVVYYRFLKKHFDARAAFLSTLVLTSSLLTVHVERHLPANMLCFWLLILSMFLFMEIVVFDSHDARSAVAAWFFLGLACLTKGPLVILFPVSVIFIYLALSCRWDKAAALRPVIGTVVFLAASAPWFFYAAVKTDGAWMRAFITHQYFWRYAANDGQVSGSSLAHVVNYLGFHLPAGFMPWTLLSVPATMSLWPERSKLRQGPLLFFGVWAISIFFIAIFSDRHHGHDLFLILSPLALAVGIYLNRLLSAPSNDRIRVWTNRFTIVVCLVLIGVGACGPFVAASQFHWTDAATGGLRHDSSKRHHGH